MLDHVHEANDVDRRIDRYQLVAERLAQPRRVLDSSNAVGVDRSTGERTGADGDAQAAWRPSQGLGERTRQRRCVVRRPQVRADRCIKQRCCVAHAASEEAVDGHARPAFAAGRPIGQQCTGGLHAEQAA